MQGYFIKNLRHFHVIFQGADVNQIHGTLLPLHCACMVGDSYSLDLLLQRGAEVG